MFTNSDSAAGTVGFVGTEADELRVWVDQDLCTGDGLCVQYAPEVFEFDVDGLAYVKDAAGELRLAYPWPDAEAKARAALEFVRGQAARLTVRLFFDSTDEGMGTLASGVVKQTDQIYDLVAVDSVTHAPPVVRFIWGSSFPGSELPSNPGQRSPAFVGVVENLQQEFSLFSPKGVPLRATLTLTLPIRRPEVAVPVVELFLSDPQAA